jgi:hypothetical protein
MSDETALAEAFRIDRLGLGVNSWTGCAGSMHPRHDIGELVLQSYFII